MTAAGFGTPGRESAIIPAGPVHQGGRTGGTLQDLARITASVRSQACRAASSLDGPGASPKGPLPSGQGGGVRTGATDFNRIVLIGASTGGGPAIETLLHALPTLCPPLVLVLHMPDPYLTRFTERLDRKFRQEVRAAGNGVPLAPGRVLVAPGGQTHTGVRRVPGGFECVEIHAPPRHGFYPSVDELFLSGVGFAQSVVGVIMTGLGRDGAEGLRQLRAGGAITIGQDKASCAVYGMPRAADALGGVMHSLPVSEISAAVCGFCAVKPAAAGPGPVGRFRP